jgi:PAS domain S-box-containing protein
MASFPATICCSVRYFSIPKVFQYSNDAILIIDPDHDLIIDANPAACSKLGYMHSALLQLPLHTLFGQHWLRWQEFAESVLKEGHGTLEDIDCVTLKNTLLPVEISASSLLLGEYRCFVLLLHDLSRHRAEEQLFHTIAQGIAALTGDEFFRALVKVLAQTLAVDYAFVSEFTQVKNRVRALAYWTPTGYGETFEYDLVGTPCEAVLKGEIRHYQEDVRNQFRRDQWLTEIGAESFLAIPLMDTQGHVFGHLAAIHTRPMAMVPRDLSLFRIFGGRATVEVLRQQA